ncbi:hypothetical protein T484DRAFT_1645188, partial [Baffinella frigidus]
QTLNPKPQTPNPEPPTPNPKTQTPNPKPQTSNPKPSTLNPKPQTQAIIEANEGQVAPAVIAWRAPSKHPGPPDTRHPSWNNPRNPTPFLPPNHPGPPDTRHPTTLNFKP